MRTIRRRLTLWYSAALAVTLLVFAATLYFDRRVTSQRELDQRLALETEFSVRYLEGSYRVLGRLVTTAAPPTLDPQIGTYFEAIRDYVLLADSSGQILFASESAAQLAYDAFQRLRTPLSPNPRARSTGTLTFSQNVGPVRYIVVPVTNAGPEIAALLVAAGSDVIIFPPSALLQSMLVSLPIIFSAAILLGYWLAGHSLLPIEEMRREMEAITGGRSLHRRLVVGVGDDELARLAASINRMFARLEKSFLALHRFTADASHELKTPLMILRAGVERALTHPRTPPESLEALDQTLETINTMTELVDNLLTLARADEGRAPLIVEETDLRDLVADAAETAGILADGQGVAVTTHVPERPVLVPVDRSRVLQLLLNLATNAVKYTPAGGEVAIALDDQGTQVEMVVRDTGIGIAAGDLPSIFDRFWRADLARSRAGSPPGTGLGLAITKWVAEAHGGTITVQSRPGRGTTFTVLLPKPNGMAPGDPG